MTEMPIGLEAFERLVAAYGADPARWPADRRAAAEALVARSAAARERLAEAAELDAWLDAAPAAPPSAALAARVLAARPRRPRFGAARWFGRWLETLWPGAAWQPVGALAMAALFGLALGLAMPPQTPDSGPFALLVDDFDALALAGLDPSELRQ